MTRLSVFCPQQRLWLFLTLLLSLQAGPARASDTPELLVLVSQRNAETIAEAVSRFHQRHPGYRITARSDSQLWELPPTEIDALIQRADLVVGMGLFGASVNVLEPSLKRASTPVLIMNSDHRLIRLSQLNRQPVFDSAEQLQDIAGTQPSKDFDTTLDELAARYPRQAPWIAARRYWQAGGIDNTRELFVWAFEQLGAKLHAAPPRPQPRLRWQYADKTYTRLPEIASDKPLLVVLDHAGGDRPADSALLDQLCQQALTEQQLHCLSGLAYWGQAGVEAVQALLPLKTRLAAVVMLQDFVMGGGEGRETVTDTLRQLNVPVIKAIKSRDRSALERQLSSDGLADDKVYYQVAMPELQGASQPLVIAAAGEAQADPLSGIRIQAIQPVPDGIAAVINRAANWQRLQHKNNADKRVALIYYNHPPGRHNIGADNLDVPASLWRILQRLKAEGYNTGTLPGSPEALLNQMQKKGINLPNDAGALAAMSDDVLHMSSARYQQWFATLPDSIQREMVDGPFGLLHSQLNAAVNADQPELARDALAHTVEEMRHLLEGVNHPARDRALALLEQLESCYQQTLDAEANCWQEAETLITALRKTGIEGLGGWGPAPGTVMTHQGELLLPGLRFGNIFIGPQPPRGWEINEELLHANLAFPPPHQYLAFYHYLRDDFQADALVHLGRHSTYEFLPRRSVGLAEDDYSRLIAGDLPGIYPYIVDGVGEGIQAKRRGLAVMVDHLTPPLAHTPLYDELLKLRQLVESFEALHGGDNQALSDRLMAQIRDKLTALELKDELAEAMSAELAVMGISFEQVDDDMLVHEVGHYLTSLQERFMPLGLHVFGSPWSDDALSMMLSSMAPDSQQQRRGWHALLAGSPDAEMQALLAGLNGEFIAPGPGNDPIRSPDALPTGRNFYALDNSLIPSPAAWELGREMAASARANNPQNQDKREALILWASDVVRDEGVMIAFGLDMLGLQPVWNSRGLVTGLERRALTEGEVRRDTVFTTSGLFRDLYSRQMRLLNRATLMALEASANTIIRDYPALTLSLQNALEPLQREDPRAFYGSENLQQNQLAAHWVKDARALLTQGRSDSDAGQLASLRVFGDAPGSYGAGVNRLVERSGAWQQRSELADIYLRRLGHSYGANGFGRPVETQFRQVLSQVENTYMGRSSNLYGLIDNNDAFDYLGGLSLAVETLTGSAPNNYVLHHADPNDIHAEPLSTALRSELRGRFLNPAWLQALMEHGYAGARTMGSEFLEYLWGWQVTNPTLVGDWAWEEVKEVYVDDRYQLGLDDFLEQGHNVHVKSNMLAIMLVAIQKGFWQADAATTESLAQSFAQLVAENGLPGSGHTAPDHPMLPWLEDKLSAEQWQALKAVIDSARREPDKAQTLTRITELSETPDRDTRAEQAQRAGQQSETAEQANPARQWQWWLAAILLLTLSAGFYRAVHQSHGKQGDPS